MPGFSINGTGGDTQGATASSTVESRRKHRWVFTVISNLSTQSSVYLAAAQRPHFILEEAPMHHNEEQVYFAGKRSWEPITLSFYDTTSGPDSSSDIWDWVNTCVDIVNANTFLPSAYKKNTTLEMIDGQGNADETWSIFNSWAKDTNWNEIDYTSTELAQIAVSLRYDRAVRS